MEDDILRRHISLDDDEIDYKCKTLICKKALGECLP